LLLEKSPEQPTTGRNKLERFASKSLRQEPTVMPAWDCRHPGPDGCVRKTIHVNLGSGFPCRNDAQENFPLKLIQIISQMDGQ
jgi:hypothetical protein